MTRETLDKLRAMGMNLGPQYDNLADTLEKSRKNDADNARILNIQSKPDTQKNDNNKYFIVRVALSTNYYVGKVEVEIDGKTFQAFQKSNVFELSVFYANVYIDFSSIVRFEENFTLIAKLTDYTNKTTDTKSIIVKVDNSGNASVTDDKVEDVNNPKKDVVSTPTSSITLEQLVTIGVSKKKATEYIDSLNKTLEDYSINTDLRIIHFLAQILHESGRLIFTSEYGKSNSDYGGFKGRGLIQLTGKSNYEKYEDYESEDFTSTLKDKQKLEKTPYSIRCAGWFWSIEKKLNDEADDNDLLSISYQVNGGFNGLDDRILLYSNGSKAFNKDYSELDFLSSKVSQIAKSAFAWGLWHDPEIVSKEFNTCKNDKFKAIEGYKKFLEIVDENFPDTNWYRIKNQNEFKNIKYSKGKKTFVKVIDAAKQRLNKLEAL